MYHIILSTPEKWDSLTRRWRDNTNFVESIKLFLVDEIHLLSEARRGPTLEAVVCRMKTISELYKLDGRETSIRFMAVSATIPNGDDLAEWIGRTDRNNTKFVSVPEEMRPVKLKRVVVGYQGHTSYFKFDMNLNYYLADIIKQYADGKPTLVFCSTRKGVELAAAVLFKDLCIRMTPTQKSDCMEAASCVVDPMLKSYMERGISYHHAGLTHSDRGTVENAFRNGKIPILLCTTTLAMGINLPAYLVIIKSTQCYNPGGGEDELPESSVLQMIGRAGRPQYNNSGIVVIMTQDQKKVRLNHFLLPILFI